MRGSKLGLLAAGALVAGLAGCSLPEVLPMVSGTTAGPSPYGPWYEQHWATNAVLLAAADQPEQASAAPEDTGSPQADAEQAQSAPNAAVEASASTGQESVDFSNSSPYQFPASSFAPPAATAPAAPPASGMTPPSSAQPEHKASPAPGGPIRY